MAVMTKSRDSGKTVGTKTAEDKIRDLARALDDLGIIDVLSGALSDRNTVGMVVSVLASDDSIGLLMKLPKIIAAMSKIDPDKLSELLDMLQSGYSVNGLSNALKLIDLLNSRGILDLVAGFLEDEEAFGYAVRLLSDDAFFSVLLNARRYVDVISKLDPDVLNTVSEVTRIIGRDDIRPVRGTMALMHELRDKHISAGLGKVFEILRELGKRSKSS
ncbi:MAG: DUF1641 domain-containing protein [Thermoplasmata archaeon YP2-bin.285]|uniref:DUF1641 domain-containing protein n=2 Tax=Candidatus Sysuiplasma superficiale TaxID=2823368 RepID=A0A8J8CB40_9ARCH|nr:DUF1641 domain-containing protein [Candidatus Sysuiplasma superficiale]